MKTVRIIAIGDTVKWDTVAKIENNSIVGCPIPYIIKHQENLDILTIGDITKLEYDEFDTVVYVLDNDEFIEYTGMSKLNNSCRIIRKYGVPKIKIKKEKRVTKPFWQQINQQYKRR